MLGASSPIEPADDSRYARLLECADRLSHPGMLAAGHPKVGEWGGLKNPDSYATVFQFQRGVGGQSCSGEPVSITGSQQGRCTHVCERQRLAAKGEPPRPA